MRSANLSAAAAFLSLGLITTGNEANAQTLPYMCMGTQAPTVKVMTLAIKNAGGSSVTPLNFNSVTNVLDLAECQCNASDLLVEMQLMMGIPNGTRPGFSVWAGSNCNATTRATTCETVPTSLLVDNFWQGGTNSNLCGSLPCQPVPITAVVQPAYQNSMTAHMCTGGTTNNGIWFLFGDLSAPDYCTIRLDALLTPPDPPTSIAAQSGDGAVDVTWQAPAQGTARPTHYQVLCGEAGPNDTAIPLAGQGAYAFGEDPTNKHQLAYSTCTDKGLQRRSNLATNGSVPSTSTDMAGSPDLGTMSDPIDPLGTGGGTLGTETDPPDLGGTGDMASVPDMAVTPVATTTTGSKHFPFLDKKFVCTDILGPNATDARIVGLTNDKPYWFLVVGTDDHGNSSVAGEVAQTPQAVEDLFRRYAADGGKGQGFCFIATAAYGSYQHPFVRILRDFRDSVLLPTTSGSAFVAWYYRTSPPYAAWIARHDVARFGVRLLLWPVIAFAWLWLALGGLVSLLVWAGAITALIARKRLGRLVFAQASASRPASAQPSSDELGALATATARSQA